MKRIVLCLVLLASVLFVSSNVYAQLPVPNPKAIIGGRMPSLSPDGKKLAFVYKGDIWVADSSGGHARTLTRNTEMDAYPQFSPDGNWIAFSSTRNGNWDIFLVPVTGGSVKQLTNHSSSDVVSGWSPDGKSVIFCSTRDTQDPVLFSLDVQTLRLRKLSQDFTAMNYSKYSPDGKYIVYSRNGFFHWSRPRYSGSGASQLWLLDVQNGTRQQITSNPFQHLWPHFTPDGKAIIHVTVGEKTPSAVNLNARGSKYVDTPLMTPNLWMHRLDGKSKQLTFFTGGSVRFPTVAAKTGDIVFEYETDLWMLKAGSTKPEKITLFASEDETQNSRRHEILKSGVTEAEPSPDGKYFAFGIRGDIWSILIDKPKGVAAKQAEIAKRLTDWAGDDSDFIWSKDGKHLYFTSDRQFNTRLYELDVETLDVKSLWDRPEDVSKLRLSPDGKELAFWVTGPEGGLYSLSVENGGYQRLVRLPGIHTYWHGGGDFAWSPDMQWIAYTFGEENGAWNVWIKPTAGGEAVNVTRLNAYHSQPVWSPDGKYLFFQSDRDGNGLYVIPLTVEPARTLETDIKFEKPKDPVEVVIDFDDISRRVRKLSSQAPQSDLTITSEGKILLISGGDIWSISYDGKDSKRLTSGGNCSALRASADGKKGYLIRNGELWTIGIEDSKLEKVEFTADWERDIRAERKAAFTQLWRSYNRLFYDANMHGRDWEAIRTRYEPLLDAVETREEFATLLGMMVGELEASHAEVGPAGGGNPSPVTPHLGFTFDYSYEGPGIKVDKVPPKAPGSYAQTEIKPGEYVVAIDGQDVTLDENLFKLINNKQNRMMTFLVNSKPTREDARTVQYTSLTWGEWTSLLYRNRIERLRKYVDDISDGKIGYVHISGMGEANQQQFDREFYEYSLDKKAMIIDVRFNGGGYISDGLVDWLERKPHGFNRTRDEAPRQTPGKAWDKPIVVLINEQSYSNAEMFPYAMRARGLAKIVGMPTPGYVIATYDLPLVDGTRARMPFVGVYRLDGSPQENDGEKPDIIVPMTPEDWLSERDPQLDKAIEVLTKQVR